MDPRELESIRRVVVTRLRWLGDVVISTSLLETLRAALPRASIEYLTGEAFAPALWGHPACDRVMAVDPARGWRATLEAARALGNPRTDWCIDTLGNPRTAIMVALARPRRSVGPLRGIRSRLYTDRVRYDDADRSALRRQLDLLTPLLGRVATRPTSLHVSEEERARLCERLGLGPETPLLVVHPGAKRAERAWPLDRWPALCEALQRARPGIVTRIITQPGWEAAVDGIVECCGGDVEGLPVLPLRDLLAVVAQAALYMGNDGGILHAAVALRVPTVGLLGRTERAAWFPYESWGPYRAVGGWTVPVDGATNPEPRHATVEEAAAAGNEVLGMREGLR